MCESEVLVAAGVARWWMYGVWIDDLAKADEVARAHHATAHPYGPPYQPML